MKHSEETVAVDDRTQIYRQSWLPDSDPVAVVALVHGLGEHCGRYGHLAERFNRLGYAVFAHDQRGHGRSSGSRGDLRLPQAVADVGRLVRWARESVPGVPLIIYGHSLGALISMTYTVEHDGADVDLQVASAPALDSELREQKLKFAAANILGGIVPGVTIPTGLDPDGVSRDPDVVAAYKSDPLVHEMGSLALAKQSFQAMSALMSLSSFPVPLLVIHGTEDRLTVPAASKTFIENMSGDVTLIEYEGMFHEPHNAPEQEQVFDDVMEWITEHLES